MEFFSSLPLFGSIANAAMIITGSVVGLLLRKKISQRTLELPVQGMAIFVAVLGIGMSIKTQYPLIVVAGIAGGSLIGELLQLEARFERLAKRAEAKMGNNSSGFAAAFVATSLIYCTGSLAVLGSFEEGLGGYPSLLLTKGLIDGLTSVAMAASLGIGTLFSSLSVFIYQGALTLSASTLKPFMTECAITEMSATGGLMLIAIGLNLLGLTKIRIMNMLPGLVVAVVLVNLISMF